MSEGDANSLILILWLMSGHFYVSSKERIMSRLHRKLYVARKTFLGAPSGKRWRKAHIKAASVIEKVRWNFFHFLLVYILRHQEANARYFPEDIYFNSRKALGGISEKKAFVLVKAEDKWASAPPPPAIALRIRISASFQSREGRWKASAKRVS